jgi:hypothetical protein
MFEICFSRFPSLLAAAAAAAAVVVVVVVVVVVSVSVNKMIGYDVLELRVSNPCPDWFCRLNVQGVQRSVSPRVK